MAMAYKVYWSREYRRYIVKHCSKKVLTTTRHDHAHEYIARCLPDGFRFYFVFAQPEIREKTAALIHLSEVMPWIRQRIGLLFSYALLDRETLECMRLLKQHGFELMLDSGAFHVLEKRIPLSRYLEYLDKYIQFVNQHLDMIDWFVTMDCPCDARPAESIQQLPNREKIELTIRNTLLILDKCDDPRKLVAVVQGYHPHEYEYCARKMRELGIVTARVGVGSLCIRKYEEEQIKSVSQILKTVREVLPGWTRLHAFGLNVRFLKHREIVQYLSSSDSDAWVYSYSRYSRLVLCRVSGSFVEFDLKEMKRDLKFKVDIDKTTIYFYLLQSYILKLKKLGLV